MLSIINKRENLKNEFSFQKKHIISNEQEKISLIISKNKNLNMYELNILDYKDAIILEKELIVNIMCLY